MAISAEDDVLLSAPLPALPDEVEQWAQTVEGADPAPAITLSRRANAHARWHRSFRLEPGAKDPIGRILKYVSQSTTEQGESQWRLSAKDHDEVRWTSTLATQQRDIVIRTGDPDELVRASWDLTFRSADKMLDAVAVAPRLIGEVGGLMEKALRMLAEGAESSDEVTTRHLELEASAKKLDRITQILDKLTGDGGKVATTPETTPAAIGFRLLSAATDEDRAKLLDDEIGRRLTSIGSKKDLDDVLANLWGRATGWLSKATLDAARDIVRGYNSKIGG